jgi:quercetin dioxygenase-like cupin family protein
MKTWRLGALDVQTAKPEVLHSVPRGRAIAIQLDAGRALDDHEVHEGASLLVASGRVRVATDGGPGEELGPGGFVAFDPHERDAVSAIEDARLLLLTPWPAPDRRMG